MALRGLGGGSRGRGRGTIHPPHPCRGLVLGGQDHTPPPFGPRPYHTISRKKLEPSRSSSQRKRIKTQEHNARFSHHKLLHYKGHSGVPCRGEDKTDPPSMDSLRTRTRAGSLPRHGGWQARATTRQPTASRAHSPSPIPSIIFPRPPPPPGGSAPAPPLAPPRGRDRSCTLRRRTGATFGDRLARWVLV